MKRSTSLLLAASLAVGIGASVFHFSAAPAGFTGPFGGSGESNLGDTCGASDSCAAVSYTSTITDGGVGFGCTGQGDCLDLGPGTCNSIATDSNGYIHLGGANSCNALVYVGDSTLIQPGQITLTNGAMSLNNSVLRDNSRGYVEVTQPLPGVVTSLGTCDSGHKGALNTLSSDGRTYQCNGTAAQTFGYRASWSGSLNFAAVPARDCSSLTFTATGAVQDEPVVPGGCGSVFAGDTHISCFVAITAADTATVRLCCHDNADCADLAAITFSATALR